MRIWETTNAVSANFRITILKSSLENKSQSELFGLAFVFIIIYHQVFYQKLQRRSSLHNLQVLSLLILNIQSFFAYFLLNLKIFPFLV